MNALLLLLVLGQSTVGVRISVQVARPTCVVIDGRGGARVVERRAIRAGERATACTLAPEAGTPRVEQRVEIEGTVGAPESRVVDITY